ncbi:hypothetical protein MWU58_03605 [Flavobacteriaceae bacterium S0825]|nr:hypothetical protein [Gaetbulibacter sp. S0825]MCK0108366.1 hypothetical protein [Flavobacteriaceae bacterium S0825]NIX64002.1 hypothetical protein [Gaetbulibacter sp. S0825]
MELIDYITGKGGIMILGLFVVIAFLYRKYKEKRYFKYIDKRIQEKKRE